MTNKKDCGKPYKAHDGTSFATEDKCMQYEIGSYQQWVCGMQDIQRRLDAIQKHFPEATFALRENPAYKYPLVELFKWLEFNTNAEWHK